jgi:hypothetical protein
VAQETHRAPLLPQAPAVVGETQWSLESQHPVAQLAGVQPVAAPSPASSPLDTSGVERSDAASGITSAGASVRDPSGASDAVSARATSPPASGGLCPLRQHFMSAAQ